MKPIIPMRLINREFINLDFLPANPRKELIGDEHVVNKLTNLLPNYESIILVPESEEGFNVKINTVPVIEFNDDKSNLTILKIDSVENDVVTKMSIGLDNSTTALEVNKTGIPLLRFLFKQALLDLDNCYLFANDAKKHLSSINLLGASVIDNDIVFTMKLTFTFNDELCIALMDNAKVDLDKGNNGVRTLTINQLEDHIDYGIIRDELSLKTLVEVINPELLSIEEI